MKLSTIQQNFRSLGFKDSAIQYLGLIAKRVMSFSAIRAMSLEIENIDPNFFEPCENSEYKFLNRDECIGYARDPEYRLDVSFVEEAFDKGDRVFGVFCDGRLACYGWYSDNMTLWSEDLELHFNNRFVYMYKGYTLPEFRGRRFHAINMARALKAYREEGCKAIVSGVEFQNRKSLKSVYRLGYRDFGWICFAKLFGRYVVYNSPSCRKFDFYIAPTLAR